MAAPDYHKIYRTAIMYFFALIVIRIPAIHGSQGLPNPQTRVPKVPDPWTPVRVEQDQKGEIKVLVWGREYYFKDSPLPSRIVTGGKDVLAAPVGLTGRFFKIPPDKSRVDGHDAGWEWERSGVILWERDDDHATLVGWMQNASLIVNAVVRIDYDGFLRMDVSLLPNKPLTDHLWLELPISRDRATLRHYWPGVPVKWPVNFGSIAASGSVPAEGLALPFQPVLWIGWEQGGLSWFCETDENWRPAQAERAIEISPGGDATIIRAHLFDAPLDIGIKTFSFGIQATPVKPWVKDFHERRDYYNAFPGHAGYVGSVWDLDEKFIDNAKGRGVRTLFIWNEWTPVFGYWRTSPDREARLKWFIQAVHQRGIKLMPYFGEYVSPLWPEFVTFGQHLTTDISKNIKLYDRNNPPQAILFSNLADEKYRKAYMEGILEAIKRYDFDGIYFDGNIIPRGSTNPGSGLGYRAADGSPHPTYPIFANREFFRKLYEAIHPLGKRIDVHNSSYCGTADMAFADSYWDGEQLVWGRSNKQVSNDPLRGFPLDSFRAEFMGRNFGIPSELLEYDPSKAKTIMGIAMLHDVLVRPTNEIELAYISPIWKALSEFGVSEAAWHPYWDNGDLVKVDAEHVKVSLYSSTVQNGTNLLLVITNFSTGPVEAHVKLTEQAISSFHTAIDALSSEPLGTTQRTITVPLAGSGWRMIEVR